jgi:hypothetical protein
VPTDTINRKRSVDVNKLDTEQVEQLIEQISKKILVMVDETVAQANKMLNVYGLEAKMQIAIQKKLNSEE